MISFLYRLADGTAGDSVAAGLERGACQEDIHLFVFQHL